jgi:PKD repeat protein
MYGATDRFQTAATIGSKTSTTAGNKKVRLTVTGKNAASTGYSMHIDYFLLTLTQGCTAPVITMQPVSQTVSVGQTATFTVSATGDAPLTYQW